MRLKRMEISGFRGFPGNADFDLDADAIVITGLNGSGKTSFFDALLWALAGSVDRLGSDPAVVVSRYSATGEARVLVELANGAEQSITVTRRFDDQMHLSVSRGGEVFSGPAADAALIDLLWPDARGAADQLSALNRSLTRATYLQQDAVRAFVEADDDQERFQVVGELVGAGRIAEIQKQIESSRNLWTRATTNLQRELEPLEAQLAALEGRVQRMRSNALNDTDEPDGRQWLDQAWDLVVQHTDNAAGVEKSLSQRTVNWLVQELDALKQRLRTRTTQLDVLQSHWLGRPADSASNAPTEQDLEELRMQVDYLSKVLAGAESAAAQMRRRQVEASERDASARALAEIALRHLDDRCPVCAQEYDREATRRRLSESVALVSDPEHDSDARSSVPESAARLAAAQQALSDASVRYREARAHAQQVEIWANELAVMLDRLGLVESELETGLFDAARAEMLAEIDEASRLSRLGERIALRSVLSAEREQLLSQEGQLNQVRARVSALNGDIQERVATGELGTQVIEALRVASNDVVTAQLEHVEPLLQRIFSTVDPHPTFRAARFLTATVRGKGRLWTTLEDHANSVDARNPEVVLSSSQLNVLATSVFLSLNLAIPSLPLQVVALDDPLQSLDNVNLLGLADLLRRTKSQRQVIVSTHDERLAGLLRRKLRPTDQRERTVSIQLRGWTSDGPAVVQSDVGQDLAPLRLVSGT